MATTNAVNVGLKGQEGTGKFVGDVSPTLTTPDIGTPSAGVLTNCTGLPLGSVTGLGTNVATFLATPSSANLAAAVTDETGSGALVFATSPTLVTPALGTPTSGTLTNCTGLPVAGGGTGAATFTAYSVICAGTTATGAFQNVSGLGTSGQVLTSNGAGALPSWQNAAAGGSASTVTIDVSQSSHGFVVGDVVRYTGTAYAKAQADTEANAEVVGIVSAVAGVNDFTIQVAGEITLSGLTAGDTYFLSDVTAGLATTSEPTTVGLITKPLYVATSTTTAILLTYRPMEICTPCSANASTTFDTLETTTSGSSVTFSSLPTAIKRITVIFNGVSATGSTTFGVRLGDSGGIETTGYTSSLVGGVSANSLSSGTSTTQFLAWPSVVGGASRAIVGHMVLTRLGAGSNVWICSSVINDNGVAVGYMGAGTKTLSAELDQVQVLSSGTFDAGSVNILYES